MPFLEYKCSGCNLVTISGFNLTDKKHLDCSGGIGYWFEYDSCPDNRHDYYTAFLNYLFCPYCGEKLIKTPEEFEGGRTPRAADFACTCRVASETEIATDPACPVHGKAAQSR